MNATVTERDGVSGKDAAAALRGRRKVAKAGMLGSMGALVLTGLQRGRGAGPLHLWAGLALLDFTYWHSRLYPTEYQTRKAQGVRR